MQYIVLDLEWNGAYSKQAHGYFNEIIFLYLATGLHAGDMQPDEDEFLEVERIPLEKAVQMVMDGALPDAKTQTAILKVWQLRQQHKI